MIEPRPLSQQYLHAQLDAGATVLTGNARLSAALTQDYDAHRLARGETAWDSPDILPWQRWILRLWEQVTLQGLLPVPAMVLGADLEQRVWESVLRQDEEHQQLLQIPAAARELQQTRQLLHQWQLPVDQAGFAWNEDSQAFYRWLRRFEQTCRENDWLCETDLAERLQTVVDEPGFPRPDRLLLTGFDELTPGQQVFLQAIEQAGCAIQWCQSEAPRGQAHKLACADSREEIDRLCRWARQRLEARPDARIGIVVPELGALRDIIAQRMDAILQPHSQQPGVTVGRRPWNLSLGRPLADYPLIRLALLALDMQDGQTTLQQACELLRSPFLAGWDSEAVSRSHIEQQLWRTGELEVSLGTLRYHAGRSGHACHSPQLAQGLADWQRLCNEAPKKASAGHWAERFSRLLDALGWARGRSLSSDEYQTHEAWRETLSAMARLDAVSQPMPANEALGQLRSLLRERIFQPETAPAPVQVLGLYESIGLRFDHLWVMGLHDEIWPPSPRPNPFIPLSLQKQHGLPHASAERELQVARTVTRRLLGSADEVVVSHPQRAGDAELRASPLIADLPAIELPALAIWQGPTWLQQVHRQGGLEPLDHDPAPAVAGHQARGGSSLFKHQSNCPFRAFAEIRLGARPPGQADIGLSPMERGSLIHRVLELVWDTLEDSACLHALSPARLEALVAQMANAALIDAAKRYPQTFTPRFREVEQQRLCRHVLDWLDIEKQRPPFTVLATEVQVQAEVGGLQVNLKIDRLDELEDGRRLVIDYKTGTVRPGQWFGERPEEPQLPLYSSVVEGELAGVLFGTLRPGAFGFNGVVAEEGLLPELRAFDRLRVDDKPASWQELLARWRQTVQRLGEAFLAGEAAVDPLGDKTCEFCELTPLCRIKELTVLDTEDEA